MSGSPGWHHANIVGTFWSCATLVHSKLVKFVGACVSVRAHVPDSSESVMATPYRRHTWFLMVNSFRLHLTWGIWDVASCQRGDSGNTETQLMEGEQNKKTTAMSSHLGMAKVLSWTEDGKTTWSFSSWLRKIRAIAIWGGVATRSRNKLVQETLAKFKISSQTTNYEQSSDGIISCLS